ncbi:MAG: hypothetical protein ACLQVD_00490 [Capsulimonadaceae bacterium]
MSNQPDDHYWDELERIVVNSSRAFASPAGVDDPIKVYLDAVCRQLPVFQFDDRKVERLRQECERASASVQALEPEMRGLVEHEVEMGRQIFRENLENQLRVRGELQLHLESMIEDRMILGEPRATAAAAAVAKFGDAELLGQSMAREISRNSMRKIESRARIGKRRHVFQLLRLLWLLPVMLSLWFWPAYPTSLSLAEFAMLGLAYGAVCVNIGPLGWRSMPRSRCGVCALGFCSYLVPRGIAAITGHNIWEMTDVLAGVVGFQISFWTLVTAIHLRADRQIAA